MNIDEITFTGITIVTVWWKHQPILAITGTPINLDNLQLQTLKNHSLTLGEIVAICKKYQDYALKEF